MNKKITKFIAMALMCVLALSAFAGCAPAAESPAATEAPASEAPVEESTQAPTEESAQETEAVAETRIITDHTGSEVEIPTEIDRVAVVSIYPLPSVITMFLGSAEKLVGIDEVSMSAAQNGTLSELFPEILNADTEFAKAGELNIESLLALEPDVVFYSSMNSAHKDMLDSAGLPAIGVSANSWEYDCIVTYDEWVKLLEQVFPEKAGKTELVSQYSQDIYDMIQERTADIAQEDRTKALFLFQYTDDVMITSGEQFFGQYWATAAGGINVAQEIQGDNAQPMNMEQVYEWDPEIVYITNFTPAQPADIYSNAIAGDDWSSVTAVKDENVYKMPLGSYRSYTPGTDTPVTLLWFAKTMYPELFEDIDLNQEVKDYYMEIYGVELTDEQVAAMYVPSSDAAAFN